MHMHEPVRMAALGQSRQPLLCQVSVLPLLHYEDILRKSMGNKGMERGLRRPLEMVIYQLVLGTIMRDSLQLAPP